MTNDLVFLVEEFPEGGLDARALGEPIFTQAGTCEEIHDRIHDAVLCHFDGGHAPAVARLHYVRNNVFAW